MRKPDVEAFALTCVCAAAIENDDGFGLDRGSNWTDHLLDMMRLLARKERQD